MIMTRGLQRATFNRSALVRVLSDTLPEATDPKYDFGERLGQWLDFSDALTLFSVLNTEAGSGAPMPAGNSDLPAQLARLRRNLGASIDNDGVFNRDPAANPAHIPARIPFPTPLPNATPESAADFSPYHRYYLAHQRDMNATITALRANARKALAGQSAAGRQLAELDATFEKFLSARERNLLANIPIMLSKHFNRRYAEHRAALADLSADDPATWTQPGSWLEAFCHDARTVLLAELELRLKPVAGLIAALPAVPGSASETKETKAP
ncbi:MAG: DUF3348 domain-containing protein [Azonexus sp.]